MSDQPATKTPKPRSSPSKPTSPKTKTKPTAGLPLERGPEKTVDFVFDAPHDQHEGSDPIYDNVSAIAVSGTTIFCSCDENATIERLVYDPATGTASGHSSFALSHLFDLVDGEEGEIDIEGLSVSDGYLWICGSHALKRAKIKEGIEDLARIKWDANRGFLGRIALTALERLMGKSEAAILASAPAHREHAAMLKMREGPDSVIRKLLAKDPIIGAYVGLPSKENGFDIEGLSVFGDAVLLGLRGPVINGYAVIVRIKVEVTKKGALKLARLADGSRYSLQVIDLNGQGIRELKWSEGRLMLLSGATTKLEALQSVFTIDDYSPDRPFYDAGSVSRVLDFPPIRGADHAEGMGIIDDGGTPRLLVVYDAPHQRRIDHAAHRLTCDLFDFA
ncbi:MAG: DUF3616 domain-containing protein [Rhizobiaceae bacterium]|nr:DUF3616 domain-containing protein [Rhizobiaceae bacterium]